MEIVILTTRKLEIPFRNLWYKNLNAESLNTDQPRFLQRQSQHQSHKLNLKS